MLEELCHQITSKACSSFPGALLLAKGCIEKYINEKKAHKGMFEGFQGQFMQKFLSTSKNSAWARSSAWSERLFQILSDSLEFEGDAFNQEVRGSNPPGPIQFEFQLKW